MGRDSIVVKKLDYFASVEYTSLYVRIEESLRSLGLSDKESTVYVTLLGLGQTTAYAVAEKSGLKRPTVYVVLDDLRKKGLVLKIPHAKKQVFTAKSPEEFFSEAEDRLRIAKSALPQLLAIAEKPDKNFRTLYFEGEKNVKEVLSNLNKRMQGKEILGFYAREPEKMPKEMREFFHDWNEEGKQLGVTLRGITPDDPSLQWYKERGEYFGAKMKYVDPKVYLSDCSIEIGDNFVQIFSLRHMQVILLENPDIASTMRQIFEMVWKCQPEPPLTTNGSNASV